MQQTCILDGDLRKLCAELKAITRVADIGLSKRDGHLKPGAELETGSAGPQARSNGQPRLADILQTSSDGWTTDIRVGSSLSASTNTFFSGEFPSVQGRHHISAITPAAPDLAMHARADLEPCCR